jgi:hypothetical protein
MSRPRQSSLFWQGMVVLGAVIALVSLVDLKFILLGIAALWIGTAAFSLHRIRRNQEL